MMFAFLGTVLAAAALLPPAPQPPRLAVPVDAGSGSYAVVIDGVEWLSSAATTVRAHGQTFTTTNGTLVLLTTEQLRGSNFTGTALTWKLRGTRQNLTWHTSVRVYPGSGGSGDGIAHAVFTQTFVSALNGTAVAVERKQHPSSSSCPLASAFPSFLIEESPAGRRGVLSFQGDMMTGEGPGVQTGPWPGGVIGQGNHGSGPLVLFNSDASTSLVLSSYHNFMAHSQAVLPGGDGGDGGDGASALLLFGLMSSVSSVPAGYTLETVLAVSSGINRAMDDWGSLLLRRYGKERYGYRNDFVLSNLGYSTDNGAYYYYETEMQPGATCGLCSTEPKDLPLNTTCCKTYKETLLDVREAADEAAVPYRYLLLDSWWYTKDNASGFVQQWDMRVADPALGVPGGIPDIAHPNSGRRGCPVLAVPQRHIWKEARGVGTFGKRRRGHRHFRKDAQHRCIPRGHKKEAPLSNVGRVGRGFAGRGNSCTADRSGQPTTSM